MEVPSGSDVTSESEQQQEPDRRESLGDRERDSSSQPWLQSIMDEIHERRDECDKLNRELDIQRQHFKQELEYLGSQLREEAIRCERLEEAMNDLTELHQNEIENIKVCNKETPTCYDFVLQSGVTDMEEKVQYQSEERLRDIQVKKILPFFGCYFLFQEQIASLETRISRMEHQAAQHQQVRHI